MDDEVIVRVLHRVEHAEEQAEPLGGRQAVLVGVRDRSASPATYSMHEVRAGPPGVVPPSKRRAMCG